MSAGGLRASLPVSGRRVAQTGMQWPVVRTGREPRALGQERGRGRPEEHSLRRARTRGRCHCWFINQSPRGRHQKTRPLRRCVCGSSRLPLWGTGQPSAKGLSPSHSLAFHPLTQACLSGRSQQPASPDSAVPSGVMHYQAHVTFSRFQVPHPYRPPAPTGCDPSELWLPPSRPPAPLLWSTLLSCGCPALLTRCCCH